MTPILWHACGLAEVPVHDQAWMDDGERDRFARMRFAKRLTEARLGRWTAKTTVAMAFGREADPRSLSEIRIRNAGDGAPELFVDDVHQPFVIAMTDRADWAVTALREGPDRIGCDLELVEPRSHRFVADYFTPSEVRTVEAGDHDLMANLIWSAKESSLKVLRTGLRRDTRTVEVRLDAESGADWAPFTVDVDRGDARHHGWWRRFGDFLLTVAASVPVDPPVALIEPSPLGSAVPSHSWMDDGMS
jgi:4'-phosphopantetheinyl transferase